MRRRPGGDRMDTKTFFENDFGASLFPLQTNLLLMRHCGKELGAYIKRILSTDVADAAFNFHSQTVTHAAKPNNHLRRTPVLDPAATYFLYDVVFRNRSCFDTAAKPARQAFGYRFKDDAPIPVHKSFQDFTANVDEAKDSYAHSLSFDIASYFNSIYHHDLVHWFLELPGLPTADADALARFFRQTNAGRSVDFLPHGIYPAKMIGSAFLRFVETNGQMKCAKSIRFMDDIYLFDDDQQVLIDDFLRLQTLLGQSSLNVNPTKTTVDSSSDSVQSAVSEIREQIAEIVEEDLSGHVYFGSGVEVSWMDDDDDSDNDDASNDGASLSDEQYDRLLELLVDPLAEEADVELILGMLLADSGSLTDVVPFLLGKFPNIVKQLYKVVGLIEDRESLTSGILKLLNEGPNLLEYQLFWIAVIAEDHLSETATFGQLVMKLYDLTGGYDIARAKVLEIPDQTFGLKEIRDKILKSGASNWHAWASAIGARTLNKAEKNHTLKYFANQSTINNLIAGCVITLS